MYRLKDQRDEDIIGDSYKEEVQHVITTPQTTYRIERVLGSRGRGPNKQLLVRWLGYSPIYDSYIPASDLIHYSNDHGHGQ